MRAQAAISTGGGTGLGCLDDGFAPAVGGFRCTTLDIGVVFFVVSAFDIVIIEDIVNGFVFDDPLFVGDALFDIDVLSFGDVQTQKWPDTGWAVFTTCPNYDFVSHKPTNVVNVGFHVETLFHFLPPHTVARWKVNALETGKTNIVEMLVTLQPIVSVQPQRPYAGKWKVVLDCDFVARAGRKHERGLEFPSVSCGEVAQENSKTSATLDPVDGEGVGVLRRDGQPIHKSTTSFNQSNLGAVPGLIGFLVLLALAFAVRFL